MVHFIKKRLQVFISSTFLDLKDERQAAVKAILEAGHITAGMELFTSGDESQMDVINQWIESSDVYLLILGGRYGSLEPNSKKSYTHLEYEYAMNLEKPLFACVMKDEYLDKKIGKDGIGSKDIYEQNNQEKFKEFKALVMSKMVFQCNSFMYIESSILKKMIELERNDSLVGWIRSNESVDSTLLSEEVARLSKENHELREQIKARLTPSMNGLSFDEILEILSQVMLSEEDFASLLKEIIQRQQQYTSMMASRIDDKSHLFAIEIINEIKTSKVFNLVDLLCRLSYVLIKEGKHNIASVDHLNTICAASKLQLIFDLHILERVPDSAPKNFRSSQRFVVNTTPDGEELIKYIEAQELKKRINI